MASRDHNLDQPIIDAAFNEFMEKGYAKASLRNIASNASVTIGAIYTRFKTKDELFYSLVEPLIKRISEVFATSKSDYSNVRIDNKEGFLLAMKHESDMILHLLFDDYDRAKLLLCKADNSSLSNFFDQLTDLKIEETIKYFKMTKIKTNRDVIKLVIKAEFDIYYQMIDGGYKLEEAKVILDNIMEYHLGGWMRLLETSAKGE